MDIRIKYMVFCGIAECEAWLSHMSQNNLESVEISTPVHEDFIAEFPFYDEEVREYTPAIFESALELM